MGFESAVWEATRPPSKPRLVADPQNEIFSKRLGRFGAGAAGFSRSDAKAKLNRIARRAPEVMMKVTGRQKGSDHVHAHLDYISRKGKLDLEDRDGDILDTKQSVIDRGNEWTEMTPYWRRNTTISSVSMVFSMPEGTDPEIVKASVRELARTEISDTHDYVMALHTDTPRPHVHLTVCARGDDGQRFDPRKADLFHFRERFAEELRARGIEAEATPRRARGVGPRGRSIALAKIRLQAKSGAGKAAISDVMLNKHASAVAAGKDILPPFVENAKAAWKEVRENYAIAVSELAKSDDPEERKLAGEVKEFLDSRPALKMSPEILASRYRDEMKKIKGRDTEKPVIRPGPDRTRSK